MTAADYRALSFWHDSLPGSVEPRPALASHEQVDVAIVGAGYTGLWAAYYLKQIEPGIRISIVEAEIAGFGASGRNGGWCTGTLAGIDDHFADPARVQGAVRLQRALFDTIAEIERITKKEKIDCHYARGGNVTFALVPAHRDLLRRELEGFRERGFGESDVHWLEPAECARRAAPARNLGGVFLTHSAAMHPALLARGLAEVIERSGVRVYERSPARSIENGIVVTDGGRLTAETVIRATEGYTNSLADHARVLMPIHSMMIATEPLPDAVWTEIGCGERETFGDPRRMVFYGQRTADDRLAFGARGKYFYGSDVRDRFSENEPAFANLRKQIDELFPVLRSHRITHRWGGPLGVPRNFRPSVGLDRRHKLAWAGGYVGEGVAASNLAARTLADLILCRATDFTTLPLIGPPFPLWEPEPLRWIGTTGLRLLGESLDAAELRGGKTPRIRSALFKAFVRK